MLDPDTNKLEKTADFSDQADAEEERLGRELTDEEMARLAYGTKDE